MESDYSGIMPGYNHQKIEKKWQRIWEDSGIYKAKDSVKDKKNFYHLVMFPYPSGNLHIGHWYNFAPGDVYARFKRMRGFNVMSPMGFDAFGLPAENAAIKRGIHPRKWTYQNIKTMTGQLKSIGAGYDWSRQVISSDPDYYKWTQWLFLQFYKNGLAYRKKALANWCVSCKTILANEQVVDGKCERCGSDVLQKEIEQWLLKITRYAEKLLQATDKLDWPEKTKTMQKNWIGKSEGALIKFEIRNSKFEKNSQSIEVFTTRPDTIFGATYLVLAPEHEIIKNFQPEAGPPWAENQKEVEDYIKKTKTKTELERISQIKEKTGVELKGIKAINPANGEKIPVWLSDYVLASYGTGAIMAVPAHDQRDFEFAQKFNLPIKMVICPNPPAGRAGYPEPVCPVLDKAYEGEGYLVGSGQFDGMSSEKAKKEIMDWLAKKGLAEKKITYRLRDWIISRQRYWGAPIPIIYCQQCGEVSVPEKDLPVKLSEIVDFKPKGKSPLAGSEKFVNARCPKCGRKAKRETDTMDTFICSSWYYLRYADPKNSKKFASAKKLEKWLPVNLYIGGAEHAVLHLLYSRFFTKVLKDLGYLDFDEPFLKMRHQGIILGQDGQKMSKSRGNVVDPDDLVKNFGSDAVRMYLCFMGPYSQGGPWNPSGINGVFRFLNRVWQLKSKFQITNNKQISNSNDQNPKLEKILHQSVKKITEDIENLRFNTAVSQLMILLNEMERAEGLGIKDYETFLKLLAPFAPHLAEELWRQKTSIHLSAWPKYDPKKIKEETFELVVQVNGKVRERVKAPVGLKQAEAEELALGLKRVKERVAAGAVKKIIFVPGRLVNIVTD